MEIIHSIDGLKNVVTHRAFNQEKNELFTQNREQLRQYSKWLDRKVQLLETRRLSDLPRDTFEKLNDPDETIYSIRRPESKGNPRVLFFTIVEEGNQPLVILLTVFKERNRGDYTRGITIAKNRIKSIREAFKED